MAVGRDVYRRGLTRESAAEARSHFERAVELDPGLARAWTFIALTHFNDALNGWGESVARSWELGHDAARRAVLADGADGWVQAVAGVSLVRQRQYEAGAKAWERALQLAPNEYGVVRDVGCDMARALGTQRAAEGLKLVRRSLELNPNRPIWQLNCLGFASYLAGQWADGVRGVIAEYIPSQRRSQFLHRGSQAWRAQYSPSTRILASIGKVLDEEPA